MPDVRSGLDPADYHLINETPDKDFSPERNRAIVERTIKEAEEYFKLQRMAKDKELEHRIDIIASYGDYRLNRGKTKQLREYLGREQYNAIIGEHLLEKLRVAEATNRLNGNTRLKKGILL